MQIDKTLQAKEKEARAALAVGLKTVEAARARLEALDQRISTLRESKTEAEAARKAALEQLLAGKLSEDAAAKSRRAVDEAERNLAESEGLRKELSAKLAEAERALGPLQARAAEARGVVFGAIEKQLLDELNGAGEKIVLAYMAHRSSSRTVKLLWPDWIAKVMPKPGSVTRRELGPELEAIYQKAIGGKA